MYYVKNWVSPVYVQSYETKPKKQIGTHAISELTEEAKVDFIWLCIEFLIEFFRLFVGTYVRRRHQYCYDLQSNKLAHSCI